MFSTIPKPASAPPAAAAQPGVFVHRGVDGSFRGIDGSFQGAPPRNEPPKSRLETLKEKVISQWHGGPRLTPAEAEEYGKLTGVYGLPSPPEAPAQESQGSPYDMVWGDNGMGTRTQIGPRYELDAKRRLGDLAAERAQFDLDQDRQKAQMELDMQRYMFDQMRRNPYGMSIRDLIYGKGGQ